MPVLFDSSGQNGTTVAGSGSGSMTNVHVVNSLATDLVAIVAVLWIGSSDTTSATISATFGGQSMSSAASPIRWATNHSMFQLFTLANPGTGAKTVSVSVASMGGAGYFIFSSATYSGVQSIGSIVSATGSTATTSNSVTVGSVAPAYRVVTVHGCGALGGGNSFSSYNETQRSDGYVYIWPSKVSEIILGDAAGSASVTGTATQGSTGDWGAFGIPLTPAVVGGDASISVSLNVSSDGALYRSGTVSPDRTWVIES